MPATKKRTKRSSKKKVDTEKFRRQLKLKHLEAKKAFSEKYPHVEKVLKEKGAELGKVRAFSKDNWCWSINWCSSIITKVSC